LTDSRDRRASAEIERQFAIRTLVTFTTPSEAASRVRRWRLAIGRCAPIATDSARRYCSAISGAIEIMAVSLREITAGSVRRITDLKVTPEQERFVASNAVSLAEALFNDEAWYRGIYLDDTPAGFVMLYDESLRSVPPADAQIGLWRFMIDHRFQGQGIGAAALDHVIAHVQGSGLFTSLEVSYVPGPGCPERFYLRAGFMHTGRVDNGEIVLARPLGPKAQ